MSETADAAQDAVKALVDERDELAAKLTKLQEAHELIESERDELKKERDDLKSELEAGNEELESALECVKDWMHDVMFLAKPMSDPRAILRTVERALDPA